MTEKKKRLNRSAVWQEARDLMWAHRVQLALGLALMLVNRLTGMVLPASSKFLIDNVVGEGQTDLLLPLAGAVLAATVVQAVTSFSLARVMSVAAQRAITTMRKRVQEHVMRLPVSYFDSTKTGVLIARIMSDAEGIRNLVGTGVVHLTGGLVTASLALVVLLYLNWQLTLGILVLMLAFAGGVGLHQADATDRLGQAAGHLGVDLTALAKEGPEAGEGHGHAAGESQHEHQNA